MAKLVVEVLDASGLMPKDGQDSSSPFVEVYFGQQRHITQTKPKDLNPQWNQTLVFNVTDQSQLPHNTIEVIVYNDRKGADGHHKNVLGNVRISASSVSLSESQAVVQRYPLDKRGLFSHIKGDIALKIYLVHGQAQLDHQSEEEQNSSKLENREPSSLLEEINVNKADKHDEYKRGHEYNKVYEEETQKRKSNKKEKEGRSFYSIRTGNKKASSYDLVEEMHSLYVNVVKARDLPVMDISGSLDPYVEVKLGNYKGVTKHLEKNQNPVWHKVFAFFKENMQSNLIEVTVKDKDNGKDDFVGRVLFDVSEIPIRVPPDSPLAPQWYRLENKKGEKVNRGEIMLAVWMWTQADEAFPEAWHSDAHDVSQHSLSNKTSKVYFSPKLYYLRVHVIAAQDLVPSNKGRALETYVKVQLGNQLRVTRPSGVRHVNPKWDDDLMLVASEPFDEFLVISVEDRIGPGKDEVLGRLIVPVREITPRVDTAKFPEARWFNLLKPSVAEEEGEKKKEVKFSSKVHLQIWLDAGYHVLDESTYFSSNLQPSSKHLQIWLDAGYHVLDESTYFSSDFQPSSKHLRKASIGILELRILGARNLLPMKSGGMTDAYCVAKYGNKWVRTRTVLNTLTPRWNEQYTWEVHDLCTVITVGVFDNWHVNGSREDARDQRIGKVRVRLSTLETDRIYTHFYPLLVLQPSGLKKHGELHLALRFTCTAWANMLVQYGKPLLPKMHYVQPIPIRNIEWLRHQAMQIMAVRLSRAEPPLRREIVEYMLDVEYHMWSFRRSKANVYRIKLLLSGIFSACRWFNDVCMWRNPVVTCLVHVQLFVLVCYPNLILPAIFLYLFFIGLRNYQFRPRNLPQVDALMSLAENAHPDELDEEFDSFPTSQPPEVVRMGYDLLRSTFGDIQTVMGDLATQGERATAILTWRDPRATAIVIIVLVCLAVFLYAIPFQVVAVLIGLYLLRHPRLRNKMPMPSVPLNFIKMMPDKSDMLL